jgi:nucleotide-binding universal stress UspA family protein
MAQESTRSGCGGERREIQMTYQLKNILIGLLPLDEGCSSNTAAVLFGVGLAHRFGADVTFQTFVPRASAPYSALGGFAAGLSNRENKRRRELVGAVGTTARAAAGEAGLTFVVDEPDLDLDELTERFNQHTRLNDITVLDAGDDLLGNNRQAIEEALFNSGRPVIVVPKSAGNPHPQRIAIAWDGSARCARAVGDALPLLLGAHQVTIVVIDGEKNLGRTATASGPMNYLERHGVRSDHVMLKTRDGDVAEALRDYVRGSDTGLIVMGAYVHSRFRQVVLGGVTHSLLEDSPVPLLLAY